MEDSSKFRGVVRGMREEYDDKTKVSVEIELPAPKAKKGDDKKSPGCLPCKPTRSVSVSQGMAASLSVGDPVEVETVIRPFGARSAGVAARAEVAKGAKI